MLQNVVFSCAGATKRVAELIAQGIGGQSSYVDLTASDFVATSFDSEDDCVLFSVPVWAGRVPGLAAERIRMMRGAGRKAIAVVVYGNRDYDDALVELCDLVSEQGFVVVAAGAFVAEHCIFPTVATNRPDAKDEEAISRFALDCKNALASGRVLDLTAVKGSRPYKVPGGVPLHPSTNKKKCVECHVCVSACPYDAINPETLETDKNRCTTCCRCISVCSQGARSFSGILYKTVRFGFEKKCSKRREPETFVPVV